MYEVNFSNLNLTIVGLGLIGGSLAKAVKKHINIGNIWAIDIDEDILKLAKDEKVIDEYYMEAKTPLLESDITIFCTYPSATVEIIKNNMDYFKSNSIVTDTSGIKNNMVEELRAVMREDLEFVGGHPMSGKEGRGYELSHEGIGDNAEYILTPNEDISDHSIRILRKLIMDMGFKRVTLMSPEDHDKRIAFTSHLPHIIACALMNNHNIEDGFDGIGGSFRDMTRVADINSDLWGELIYENRVHILDELDNFLLDINKIYDTLKMNDIESLKSMMKISSLKRKEMDR